MKIQIWHLLSLLGSAASTLHCGAGRAMTTVVQVAEAKDSNEDQPDPAGIPVPQAAAANQALEPIASSEFIQTRLVNTNWKLHGRTDCQSVANEGFYDFSIKFTSTTNMTITLTNFTDAACQSPSGKIVSYENAFTLTPSDLIDGWKWDYKALVGDGAVTYDLLRMTDDKLYWGLIIGKLDKMTEQTRPHAISTGSWFAKVP